MDVQLMRLADAPVVLGTGQLSVKAGAAAATLQVYGANLPAVTPADVNVGQGVKVTDVVSATPSLVSLRVSVAAEARPGPRDVSVAGAVRPAAFVVYDKVDGIRVLPRAGLSRAGGVVYPKQYQQFEAMAFANGPDGKSDTDDDWPLGLVDAKGLFTPAADGPNPERRGNRNNIGDVWVIADYTPDGTPEPIRARAHLLVAPPVFMRWIASEVGK